MSYFYDNSKTTKGTDNAFGIVTVMDVHVYEGPTAAQLSNWEGLTPTAIANSLTDEIAVIDHLQVATLSTDGPNISIQGGKSNNILLKHGKSARCEMTDALAQTDALVALGGAEMSTDGAINITEKFPGPVTLVGDSYVVDKVTGKQKKIKIIMYQFLPDAIPSIAFDSGNAATFDMNGDLLATTINAGAGDCNYNQDTFYSIIEAGDCTIEPVGTAAAITVTNADYESNVATALPGQLVVVTAKAVGAKTARLNVTTADGAITYKYITMGSATEKEAISFVMPDKAVTVA